MKTLTSFSLLLAAWLLATPLAYPVSAAAGPYVDGRFQGRIAYSSDGNHNDPDDWAASPVTLAILAEAGLKDRLVHFDFNCILPLTDPEWKRPTPRARSARRSDTALTKGGSSIAERTATAPSPASPRRSTILRRRTRCTSSSPARWRCPIWESRSRIRPSGNLCTASRTAGGMMGSPPNTSSRSPSGASSSKTCIGCRFATRTGCSVSAATAGRPRRRNSSRTSGCGIRPIRGFAGFGSGWSSRPAPTRPTPA